MLGCGGRLAMRRIGGDATGSSWRWRWWRCQRRERNVESVDEQNGYGVAQTNFSLFSVVVKSRPIRRRRFDPVTAGPSVSVAVTAVTITWSRDPID